MLYIGGIKYEIRSEGCEDPGKDRGCGQSFIWINGLQRARQRRGINAVVVSQQTGECKLKGNHLWRNHLKFPHDNIILMRRGWSS